MVLPICQRVTYWRNAEPVIVAAVPAGLRRSTTRVITCSVVPSLERCSWLLRMSMPRTFVPPMTGKSASPAGSLRPATGAFDGPDTAVPNRPIPDDCRAIVTTPAPQ